MRSPARSARAAVRDARHARADHIMTGRRLPRQMTVVPAYRLEGHFAEQALNQAEKPPLDVFRERLRLYVRRLLAGEQPAFIDIGEHWTMTQTGDPDLNAFIRAVNAADAAAPRGIVEDTLVRCSQALPRPDLLSRVVILMGDGESRGLTQAMQHVNGVSLGSGVSLLFLWPAHNWRETLAYVTAHEYVHLVRNRLFPRGVSGGRMIYIKNNEPDTLLDAMVTEGIADAFAEGVVPEHRPHWITALPPAIERAIWPNVEGHLNDTDPAEIRRYLFGDDDRVPVWTGHSIGYAIVRSYLATHPDARIASIIGLSSRTLLEESGYRPGEQT